MIDLKLKNFKCFENKTFSFSDEMVLISAPSGSGKTTILSAIKFALWGGKRATVGDGNEIMHGKTTCVVTLTYTVGDEKFIIQRSKRPNRVTFQKIAKDSVKDCVPLEDSASCSVVEGDVHEDQDAQTFIDNYFGSQSQNTFTGAVSGAGNFIDSSSSDKLEYLEKMAFGEASNTMNVDLLKVTIKDKIRMINDDIKSVDGQLCLNKKLLNSLKEDKMKMCAEHLEKPERPSALKIEDTNGVKPQIEITGLESLYEEEKKQLSKVEILRNKTIECKILKSQLDALETRKTENCEIICGLENDISKTLNDISSMSSATETHPTLSALSQNDIQKMIVDVQSEQATLGEAKTKMLIDQFNIEMLVSEKTKLIEMIDLKNDMTPPSLDCSILSLEDLVTSIDLLKKKMKFVQECIMNDTISKSKIETFTNDMEKISIEIEKLQHSLNSSNDYDLKERLTKLYNNLDAFNKLSSEKKSLKADIKTMVEEKERMTIDLNVLKSTGVEANTDDSIIKVIKTAEALNESILENLENLSLFNEKCKSLSDKKKILKVLKVLEERIFKEGNMHSEESNKDFGDLRCPKCSQCLSINNLNGRYGLHIKSEDKDLTTIYETFAKVTTLISLMSCHDLDSYEKQIEAAALLSKINVIENNISSKTSRLCAMGGEAEESSGKEDGREDLKSKIQEVQTLLASRAVNESLLSKEKFKLSTCQRAIECERQKCIPKYDKGDEEDVENRIVDLESKLKIRQRYDIMYHQYQEAKIEMNTMAKRKNVIDETIISIQDFYKEVEGRGEALSSLSSLDERLNELSTRLKKLLMDMSKRQQLDKCNDELLRQKKLHKNYTDILTGVEGDIKNLIVKLGDDKKCSDDLEKSVKTLEQIKDAIDKQKLFDTRMDRYNQYLKIQEQYSLSIEKHTTLTTELEGEAIKLNDQYTAAITLKSKISEAQGLALSSLVDTINVTVQPFLDVFFEEPMVINLSMFKEDACNKKPSKPKVTINLYYKGVLCPQDLSSLSSGEYARVSLAFTLAFHQINNNKFTPLMLDERTANLDQDLSTLIYSVVKETFSSQLIMVVAHQVITGPFDNVMTL
jgi:DNA repair exonuclease SbcCD ATPase subunit